LKELGKRQETLKPIPNTPSLSKPAHSIIPTTTSPDFETALRAPFKTLDSTVALGRRSITRMATSTSNTNFKKIQTINPTYAIATITQYESTRTGMRVAVVDRKSTKVTGEFALATEIHDDSGAPHTLEHLIFLVSEFIFQ
jgi:hypothetical protein